VEDSVVIELKTVEELSKAHYAQVRSYLAASGLTLGLLVNFSTFKADFRRVTLQ
jgi:GxxExxY protein